jgi:hypothetical protein
MEAVDLALRNLTCADGVQGVERPITPATAIRVSTQGSACSSVARGRSRRGRAIRQLHRGWPARLDEVETSSGSDANSGARLPLWAS